MMIFYYEYKWNGLKFRRKQKEDISSITVIEDSHCARREKSVGSWN